MQVIKIQSLSKNGISGGMGLVLAIRIIAILAFICAVILLFGGLAGREGLGLGGIVAAFSSFITGILMLAVADMVASLRVIRQVALRSMSSPENPTVGK